MLQREIAVLILNKKKKKATNLSLTSPTHPLSMIQCEEHTIYIPSGDWLGPNDLCKKSIACMENVVEQCKRAYF